MSKATQPVTRDQALAMVKTVLERIKLKATPLEAGAGFVVEVTEPLAARGLAHVLDDEERFVFYLELVERVPPERRLDVAELVTRANYGLVIGNFELDFGEGRVRYKTSFDYGGLELSQRMIRNVVLDAMSGVEPYAKAIANVAAGRKGAAAAIEEAEAAMDVE